MACIFPLVWIFWPGYSEELAAFEDRVVPKKRRSRHSKSFGWCQESTVYSHH